MKEGGKIYRLRYLPRASTIVNVVYVVLHVPDITIDGYLDPNMGGNNLELSKVSRLMPIFGK